MFVAPCKSYDFSTIYQQCPHDVDVYLLFGLTLTSIRLVPKVMFNMDFLYHSSLIAKAMTFQQSIMHVLHYPHDGDVHLLFCYDRDLHLTCSQGHA